MRPCPSCGTLVSPDDEFCGNCGTYLGWSRTEPEPAAAAASGSALLPPDPEPGSPATHDLGAGVPPDRSTSGQPPAADARTPRPRTDRSTSDRTPSGPAPVRPGVPEAEGDPVAVQPAVPVAPRPTSTAPLPATLAEGVPCPHCGTLNPQGRNYCRRCATPLTAQAAEAAEPWWKRIRLPHRNGSGALTRRLVVLVVLIALVIAGVALYPLGQRLFQDLLDKTSEATAIAPVSVTASGAVEGHPATAAADGISNRYWGAPVVGSWVEFGYDQPFRFLSVIVHGGASSQPEEFTGQARPALLDIEATTSDGTVTRFPAALVDDPGPQRFDTATSDVVKIRVVVKAAVGLTPGRHIAVGEIEVFRRS